MPVSARRLDHRQSFQLHVDDRQPLPVGQLLEQLGQIAPRIGGLGVGGGEHVEFVIERIVQRLAPRAPAQQIHQLVARDRVHPCRQRLVGIVGVALVVHRQQRFLHEILHFVRQAGRAAS